MSVCVPCLSACLPISVQKLQLCLDPVHRMTHSTYKNYTGQYYIGSIATPTCRDCRPTQCQNQTNPDCSELASFFKLLSPKPYPYRPTPSAEAPPPASTKTRRPTTKAKPSNRWELHGGGFKTLFLSLHL